MDIALESGVPENGSRAGGAWGGSLPEGFRIGSLFASGFGSGAESTRAGFSAGGV